MRSGGSIVGLVVISFGLAGCLAGTEGGQRAMGSPRPGQVIERDIEAPNVFSRRERALWDGRPSLGGVWVAHPDARTPERVIIRNTENGKETVGALFRRERMNPGPVFQMSADAAVAVEMLAGAPTMVEVIALRTEEVTIGGAPAPEPEGQPEPEAPQAVAVAAPAVSAPAPAAAPATTPAVTSDPDDGTFIALTDEPAARPARTNPLSRLFGRRDRATPDTASADQITTQSLDDAPIAQAASAAPTMAPMPTPSPQPAASAAAAPAAASSLSTPFVQLGIFSVEANANRARALAEGAGLSARVVQGTANGNAFWRVVVGPAQDQASLRALIAQTRALGFNDAYAVRR